MEIAIPLVALSGLYFMNKNSRDKKKDGFTQPLPNTNIPDKNYPSEFPIGSRDLDQTASLTVDNRYEGDAYTDKYFKANSGEVSKNMGTTYTDQPTFRSLNGEQVDLSYFSHNNMTPYFGSHVRNTHSDMNSNESVLDSMNGSGSQQISKKEQSPLFTPHNDIQWANGMPNHADFVKSRINVSNRMANVKPFADQKVAPGLGLGATTEGSGGFNSGMAMRDAWMDKGVDDLRVASKPKAGERMILGRENPGMSKVNNVAEIGRVEKNRVDTSYEMGSDRWMTTRGVESAPTMNATPIMRYVSRPETTTSYIGGAGPSSTGESTYMVGEYMPSTNIELGAVPYSVPYAGGKHVAVEGEYGSQSFYSYPNNRSENRQASDYMGIVGSAIGAVVSPLLDVLRPSRKENTIGTLRPYQNAKSGVSQSYIFNPADRPSATIRETTENSKYHHNIDANQRGGAYQTTAHQATDTYRQETSDYYYAGNASRNTAPRTYDAEYKQRNNDIKSSTIQGYMVQGNMSLFNADVNMETNGQKETLHKNKREVVPQMPYQSPTINQFGLVKPSTNTMETPMDRNTAELLNVLKSNPYAIPSYSTSK